MHYKRGKPTKSVIRKGDLLHGSLSFWRSGNDEEEFTAAKAKIELNKPQGHTLKHLFCPKAIEIRQISLPNRGRIMCVIDDCTTDNCGGSDPKHCGVKLCDAYRIDEPEEEICIEARNQLYLVLKKAARDIE